MKIYIDSEFKCYTSNSDGIYREVETTLFNAKCNEFVEGYRYVPSGESWTRSDGAVFYGEMIAPWKPYSELDGEQREYERQQFETYKNENTELKSNQNELNVSYQEGINSI